MSNADEIRWRLLEAGVESGTGWHAGWAERFRALERLLGGIEEGPDGLEHPTSFDLADLDLAEPQPLPTDLRRVIVDWVELHHRAHRRETSGAEVFILPPWIALGDAPLEQRPSSALRIRIDRQRAPLAVLSDDWKRRHLKSVLLSPRTPDSTRRRRIAESAESLLADLCLVLGSPLLAFDWVQDMLIDPGAVESAAIELWGRFLDSADVPLGLRIPGFELSIKELLTVVDGPDGGRDRKWFANEWPAAASALFRSGKAKKVFRKIEFNRSAGVRQATRAFCCAGNPKCEKAARFAQRAARYSDDPNLARLLAGSPDEQLERHIRALLMEANDDASGEILRRMGRLSTHAREQMELAVAVAIHPAYDRDSCAFWVGKLATRTLAGTDVDPKTIDPEIIAGGLSAVSADCLAAFAAERTWGSARQPLFRAYEEAGRLERGILAFVTLLSVPAWRLTPRQFIRFLTRAERRAVHQVEPISRRSCSDWPTPPGWREEDRYDDSNGGIIEPLVTVDMVVTEGGKMKNCLRGGGFDRAALVGKLALFSVRSGKDRATLALQPHEMRDAPDRIRVLGYELFDLKGKRNSPPAAACRAIALALLERLNARTPLVLDDDEVSRRECIREEINRSRSFNADQETANERWQRIYLPGLPRRFRSTSPAEIVEHLTTSAM